MAEETSQTSKGKGFKGALTGKVAGVPAWGIGVGLAGLLILFLYLKKRGNNAANGAQASTDTSAGDAVDPNTGLLYSEEQAYDTGSGTLAGLTGSSNYPVGLTANGTPAPTTNIQWENFVSNELLAKGDDPTLVSQALTKYLSGGTLSAAEQGIVNLALQMFGPPPEGLLPVQTTPGTPATPTPLSTPSKPTTRQSSPNRVIAVTKPVAGATGYEWQINGSDHAHTVVPSYSYVLDKGTWTLSVKAFNNSQTSPTSPTVKVTIK